MRDALVRRLKIKKETSTLKARILSAVVLIPLSLYIIYLGKPYSLIFGGLVAIGVFVEWGVLCGKSRLSKIAKSLFICLGSLYLILSVLWLMETLALPEGWQILYWLLFLVWSTDIFAYVGGRFFKGPKLVPSISPNKTWSGFVFGMLGGTSIAYETSFWLVPEAFSFWGILLLVFISQLGDLLESKAKRWSDVKDSSGLIPGHGGILDRLDSLLAVSFAIVFWQMIHFP